MKIVIQRVKRAQVSIDQQLRSSIGQGLLLLVGGGPDDSQEDMDYAVRKIVNMRIFSDAEGKMNLSIKDIDGEILSISQFTLHADTKKGNRPAFVRLLRQRWLAIFMMPSILPCSKRCRLGRGFLEQTCR